MYAIAPAGVRRLSDNALIRRGDPGWPEYLAWLSAGGVPDPLPPSTDPPASPVPVEVTRFQARAALFNAGLLNQAAALAEEAGGIAYIAWIDAQGFRRDSPTIAALAPGLGLDDADLDALFIAASQIIA